MAAPRGKLDDKVAIVTGAAQGMGFAIASLMAREGARVALCDISGDGLREAAARIEGDGAEVLALPTDVGKEDQVAAMVEAVLDEFGSIHILVNNAGILHSTRIEAISPEEWDLVMEVNLRATFLCSQAVLATMKRNGFGRIINMSSSAGRSVSTLGGAHYTSAKAGVLGFTRALAKEMAPHGITANAICPGLIDTEMVRRNCDTEKLRAYEQSFPIPRLGTPGEVARLALFLAADSPYTTGASIDINGGDLML